MDDKDFMRFKLGGVNRHMSLMDFTRCLQIYSPEQMSEKHFKSYIWLGARVSDMNDDDYRYNTDGVFDMNEDDYRYFKADCWGLVSGMNEDDFHNYKAHNFWEYLTKQPRLTWSPGNVSCLDIHLATIRLLHLVLTHNFTHRTEDTDKVLLSDLWLIQKNMSMERVNIPYCVAYYLKHWATGVDPDSPICGGHYITLIARHLDVKCDNEELLLDRRRLISVSEYNNAKVLREEKPETTEPPSEQHLPYTASYTALYLLTWLTNLELIYKNSSINGNKLEQSENIQMLLDLIDEIEQFLRSLSLNSHPENVMREEAEIEQLDPMPTNVPVHEIVTCMNDVRFGLENTLTDKNELVRLQQYWSLTEYVRQICVRLAGFKESSRIKLDEINCLKK